MAHPLQGRETSWCCIACGMPFSYPIDCRGLYSSDVSTLANKTFAIADAVRDPSLSCAQWDKTRVTILPSIVLSDFGARAPKGAGWSLGFEALCTGLFGSLRAGPEPPPGKTVSPGPGIMNFYTLMCQGCSIVSARTWENAPGRRDGLDSIPWHSAGAHDEMCAVYLLCMQISSLVADRSSQGTTESRAWRLDGLIHLYTGYLVFIAGGANRLPFHSWYMYMFHPLRSYEEEQGHGRPLDSLCRGDAVATVEGILGAVIDVVGHQHGFDALREWAKTDEMIRLSVDKSIPWAPACVLYGFSKEILFGRFVRGVKGYFRSDKMLWSLLDDYLALTELWWQ